MKLHLPAGSAAAGDDLLLVTPETAAGRRLGLRIVRLAPGASRVLASGGDEIAVLPLSGGGCSVEVESRRFELSGRESVFARISDWAYVPIHSELRLSSAAGCELALASARATRRFDPAYLEAEGVPVELRGAGPATRQVANFMVPEVFDGADRLICCELLTPDGNWSSYPPHKHDATTEVDNEEIYYFRVGRPGSTAYSADGYGVHRTYTDDRSIDATVIVRDGDAFLVPAGYHGPCIAAPGYPLYYLNVMASDAGPRKLAFVDDPPQHWIRSSWDGMALDPRLPMTSARASCAKMRTVRLTTAQAIVRFLIAQRTVIDGEERPLFAGVFAHLRARQRDLPRRGAGRRARRAADVARTERAGDGAGRGRVRQGDAPAPVHGRHVVDRPGRDEHGHRRRVAHANRLPRAAARPATPSSSASPTRCCNRSSTSTTRRSP